MLGQRDRGQVDGSLRAKRGAGDREKFETDPFAPIRVCPRLKHHVAASPHGNALQRSLPRTPRMRANSARAIGVVQAGNRFYLPAAEPPSTGTTTPVM